MEVEGQLIKYNERDEPVNFVSLAVYLNANKVPYHAAILIRHLSEDFLFHYPGNMSPLIENLPITTNTDVLVYKILENFDTEDDGDVGAFLQHCKRVSDETDITYGFILDGSSYGADGRFQSLSGLPEIATCVGFCLNVLANTLTDVGTSIFALDEWDDMGINVQIDVWARQQALLKIPSLDWNLYNAHRKRITPLEYLGSSFFDKFPITKSSISTIIPEIEAELQKIV